MNKSLVLTVLGAVMLSQPADASPFGGIEFPQGGLSFADRVVDYQPGSGVGADYRLSEQVLDSPDYTRRCAGCDYVSLGNGGFLTVEFTDNWLTASGNSDADLWVFEIGTAVEAAFVEISRDGQQWFEVGQVGGATDGVDLDAYGFNQNDRFSFVRLIDDLEGAGRSYPSAGADIDSIGAISTIAKTQGEPATDIPEPSTLLMVFGTMGLVFAVRGRS